MDMNEERRKILLNSPHLETVSGSIASFYTNVGGVQPKSIKVSFLPKQEGSGTPSPDNVRPINGWLNIPVTIAGKNLYDQVSYPLIQGYWVGWNSATSGMADSNYACIGTTQSPVQPQPWYPVSHLQGATITLNKRPGGTNPGFRFRDINGNNINGTREKYGNNGQTAGTPWTVTIPENAVEMCFSTVANDTRIQIELGSSATEYEQYKGKNITISLPSTFYGGHIDLINGELAVERVAVDFLNPSWFYSTKSETYGYVQFGIGSFSLPISDIDVVQSSIVADRFDFSVASGRLGKISWYNGNIYGNAPIEQFTTYNTAGVNAWKEEYKPIITIRLKNPICYKLATQVIKTLRGINSIWSDAGEVEVKYWTH